MGNRIEFSESCAAAHPFKAGPRYSVNKHVQQMRTHGHYHLCAYTGNAREGHARRDITSHGRMAECIDGMQAANISGRS